MSHFNKEWPQEKNKMAATDIQLPLDIIKQSCGFSFDIGGSVAKIIYRSKKDFLNGEPRNPEPGQKTGIINLRLWPRNQIDEVIEFIKENVDFTKHDGKIRINTTGIGGNLWKKKLEVALGIEIENKLELDCFTKAFKYAMDNLPPDQLFHPIEDKAIDKVEGMFKLMGAFVEKSKEKEPEENENTTKFDFGKAEDIPMDVRTMARKIPTKYLPCLLAMCGSGVGFTYIDENRQGSFLDGSGFGGRLFLGMSAALTGVKDFDELMEMATRGDGKSVDQFASDVVDKNVEDSYTMFQAEEDVEWRVFPFGKVVEADRESLKPDDLVQSTLTIICETLAQLIMNCCRMKDIHNIFFCGNFINHPTTREILLVFMYLRAAMNMMGECHVQFLRHGGFLGGIGAFMLPPSEDKPQESDVQDKPSAVTSDETEKLSQKLEDVKL